MNRIELTAKQTGILAYIKAYAEKHKRPPTVRKIANEHGIASTNGVRCHLAALTRKGSIAITPRVARGIQLTPSEPVNAEHQL